MLEDAKKRLFQLYDKSGSVQDILQQYKEGKSLDQAAEEIVNHARGTLADDSEKTTLAGQAAIASFKEYAVTEEVAKEWLEQNK